ncbi:uncharacterized protein LOC141714132 [Apium graveolens]|uniref:uncharacterized protein LOC141714132 n=1 Tax=Apium graveolens TaxID=4045 RepID=UPI003D79114A
MTKWAEDKAMRTINQQDCIKFMYAIIMRFVIPVVLVSDNGPQFVGSDFEVYLKELGIKHKRAYVAHPQGNGQVEVTNRTILWGLEKRSWYQSYGLESLKTVQIAYKQRMHSSSSSVPSDTISFSVYADLRLQFDRFQGKYDRLLERLDVSFEDDIRLKNEPRAQLIVRLESLLQLVNNKLNEMPAHRDHSSQHTIQLVADEL